MGSSGACILPRHAPTHGQRPELISHPLPSLQAPGDTEFSLYDSEEDGPSYWDLEQEMFGTMFHTETLTAL